MLRFTSLNRRPELPLLLAALLFPAIALAGGEPKPQPAAVAQPMVANSTLAGTSVVSSSKAKPANPETAISLQPFRAFYQAEFDLGIHVNGEAIRELTQTADGQWQLSMKASAIAASIDESSRFALEQGRVTPQHYHYQRKLLTKKKTIEHRFDWPKQQLTSSIKGDQQQLPLQPGTLDKVGFQIQLWQDIKGGANEATYPVADGRQIKTYEFDRLGSERISTPAGEFDTIKVARDRGDSSARKTYIWFASELDHVIVKLQQIEPDGKKYTLVLERLESL
ncbi:DUF3108 domain-containing protein [Motiliproteus sp.]|uniref:DUF3108 domain-containing protein n=1 Tax=Motiliproteus sp. TaxID=1898955 RepID=UPI003BAA1AA9